MRKFVGIGEIPDVPGQEKDTLMVRRQSQVQGIACRNMRHHHALNVGLDNLDDRGLDRYEWHLAQKGQCLVFMGKGLTRFDSRFDRLSGESGRGIAQDMQGRLVKCRREPPCLESRPGQHLYMLQPYSKRRGLRQCLPRIVGDDAPFLRSPIMLKTVTAGAAR